MKTIATSFLFICMRFWSLFILWALVRDEIFIYHHLYIGGVVGSLLLLPATYFSVPVWELISNGTWFGIILTYGPLLIFTLAHLFYKPTETT